MTVRCPHCAKPIANSPAFAGRLVKCPNCTQQFKMPLLGGPPPVPAATPAPVQAPRPSQSASADQGVSDQELFGAIVGGGPEQAAASPGGSAHKRTRTSKVGIAAALVTGLVVGYVAGSARIPFVPGDALRGRGATSGRELGPITKKAWIEKARRHNFLTPSPQKKDVFMIHDVNKDAFLNVMGTPRKIERDDMFPTWYYQCSDGEIWFSVDSHLLEVQDKIRCPSYSISERH